MGRAQSCPQLLARSRLHGEIGWLTAAERSDGTPFTDRGFESVPALAHLQAWLEDIRAAA